MKVTQICQGDLDDRVIEEFNSNLKEERLRREGVASGNWFSSWFSDKDTQPTERDRQLDEAYEYISARISPAI